MTFREKYIEDWGFIDSISPPGCPHSYGYEENSYKCGNPDISCRECWDREMPEEEKEEAPTVSYDDVVNRVKQEEILKEQYESGMNHTPSYVTAVVPRPSEAKAKDDECYIRDSGDRTEFPSGAVRDMREGKGRCDLLPLDVICSLYLTSESDFNMLTCISEFQKTSNVNHLYETLILFTTATFNHSLETMILEVAKHFEEGAKKYGDNNWQKGIPVRCYIDSAVRHYLKYLRGDKDEPHDRAFCWNILCAIWTCKHKPELNDYAKDE